jgi:hypothetical protein
MSVRQAVQPLEDVDVGIGPELVAVDPRIRRAGHHLVVAGVRERHAIGDLGAAAQGLVAENLPLLRDRAPQERQQHPTPLGDIVAPEVPEQRRLVEPAAAFLVVQQRFFGAGEHFLPTQAVGHDQDHVLGAPRRGWRTGAGCVSERNGGARRRQQADRQGLHDAFHGRLLLGVS